MYRKNFFVFIIYLVCFSGILSAQYQIEELQRSNALFVVEAKTNEEKNETIVEVSNLGGEVRHIFSSRIMEKIGGAR